MTESADHFPRRQVGAGTNQKLTINKPHIL